MPTDADFDDLREACRVHNQAGRHREALATAEEAWRRFPERRHFTWYLIAYANLRLGRPDEVIAAIERAEAGNYLWRIGLLRALQEEVGDDGTLLGPALDRAEARIAAKGFKAELLVSLPDDRPSHPAPLLLGFHGATGTAGPYHEWWLPATRRGCVVASLQSSQPATETTFCWDDRTRLASDVATVLPALPPHGPIVLTGFSQGAAVALELALAGSVPAAEAVIAVGPSFGPMAEGTTAIRRLRVVVLHGSKDPWARTVAATARWLCAAGHHVTVEEVPDLGHQFPPDFPSRLDGLLANAGVTVS